MTGVTGRSGGARPGAGRPKTTYRLTETPARQLLALATKRNVHPDALLAQLIADAARQDNQPMHDDVMHLLNLLTPEPQTVAILCRRLRLRKPDLEQLVVEHMTTLIENGLHLHVATHSEVATAIKLPGSFNNAEPTYYNKLSRNLFSLK
ncbi:MAG: hypothetical protein H0X37_18785 [Herpetosiphonaceae bacterium]|nr:hypothetical protein [Herpetosiphonaceae bacterium]